MNYFEFARDNDKTDYSIGVFYKKNPITAKVTEFKHRGFTLICYCGGSWKDVFKIAEKNSGLKVFEGGLKLRGKKNTIEACKKYLDSKSDYEMESAHLLMEDAIKKLERSNP